MDLNPRYETELTREQRNALLDIDDAYLDFRDAMQKIANNLLVHADHYAHARHYLMLACMMFRRGISKPEEKLT